MWFTIKKFARNEVVRRLRFVCRFISSVGGLVPEEYTLVSSAYTCSCREHEMFKKFMSFKNILKSSGPRIEPILKTI